jgi:hypothetical protein
MALLISMWISLVIAFGIFCVNCWRDAHFSSEFLAGLFFFMLATTVFLAGVFACIKYGIPL